MSEARKIPTWMIVAGLVVVGLVIFGISGGDIFAPVRNTLRGPPPDETPTTTSGDLDKRAKQMAGDAPTGTGQSPLSDTATTSADTTTPPTNNVQQNTEPAPDTRRAERHLLALDSPLTPPVADLAERINQSRQDRRTERDEREAPPTGTIAPAAGDHDQDGNSSKDLHILERGTVIPAILQSAIDSDLPGLVRAQVSDNVFDSRTGTHVLIPRGARLIGTYGTHGASATSGASATGQRRLFVTWTDLRLPDGTPIDLERFSTLGPDGASGVKGRRTTGFWKALGAAVLFDLAGNATAILTNQPPQAQPQGDLSTLIGAALGNATSQVATGYIGSLLNQSPRWRIAPGSFMNVLIEQDLSLPTIGTGVGAP